MVAQLCGGQFAGLLMAEPIILVLHVPLPTQRLVPTSLQLSGHESILRFDRPILPGRTVSLKGRSFPPLLPMLFQPLSLGTQFGLGCQTQLQGGRLEDLQYLFRDKHIELCP